MIKAVIYDSDGMITHDPGFSKTYSQTYNIPLDDMSPFFKTAFKDCLIGKADLREELQKGWLEKWQWKKSVDEFLDYWFSVGDEVDQKVIESIAPIKAKNIQCVLATNNERRRTDYLVNKANYKEIFNAVYSSGYVGAKKPSAEFFQYVFDDLKKNDPTLEKENVLFWDDDVENIEGAKSFGIIAQQYADFDTYNSKMREILG